MQKNRRTSSLIGLASAAVMLAASPALAGDDERDHDEPVRAKGLLIRYGDGSQVPEGATARVKALYDENGTTRVTLRVRGMLPNHEYGAHAHVAACSPTDPMAAGGHFQHEQNPDPSQPTDPEYANPENEIWLDLTTDHRGRGVARTTVPWQFDEDRRAGSVVIHETHTHSGPPSGPAGTAGGRLACLTVPF